jgi:hypothetical protein
MICRRGAGGGCIEPNKQQTAFVDCPNCKDGSCGQCDDGTIVLTECPCKSIPRYIFTMIEISDCAEDKIGLPVGGGTLDQTQAFLDSMRFVKAEKQKCRNQLGKD